MGTAIVIVILVLAVVMILRHLINNKRKGISSCGGGCAGCPNAGRCGSGSGTLSKTSKKR